jgi:hypothetical protein
MGPDLSTDKPQVDGLSGNVTFVPTQIGTKLGTLVVQACQANTSVPARLVISGTSRRPRSTLPSTVRSPRQSPRIPP